MKTANQILPWRTEMIVFPSLLVLSLWIVYWFEIRFSLNWNYLGIYPGEPIGLIGILTGPFLHGSLKHLFNNSVPLLVLTVALFYFYRNVRWQILIYGWLLTGLLTWIIGRPSLHIGASGIVYMLVAFLFFRGVISKQFQFVAVALVVVFLYGGLWWYLFPIDPGISWEGHLSGFIVGLVFSLLFRELLIENKKYHWEREDYDPSTDPFMQQFDEKGNFIGTPKPEADVQHVVRIKQKSAETYNATADVAIKYSMRSDASDDVSE